MNIAMLTPGCVPSTGNEEDIIVGDLAVILAAQGHNVTVINLKRPEFAPTFYKGVRLVYVPSEKGGRTRLAAAVKAAFGDYGVIHIHAPEMCRYLPLFRLAGKRTAVTFYYRNDSPEFLKYERAAAAYADDIIVQTENLREYFENNYHRKAVCVKPAVKPCRRLEPNSIKREYGLKKKNYILCLGGRLSEADKASLIDIYRSIPGETRLVVGGDAADAAESGLLLRRALKDSRVVLVPDVRGSRLSELVSNCIAYICPDSYEGNPWYLLKAACSGAECYAGDTETNTGAAGRLLHTYPTGDTEAVRRLLTALISGTDTGNDGISASEREELTKELVACCDSFVNAGETEHIYTHRRAVHRKK